MTKGPQMTDRERFDKWCDIKCPVRMYMKYTDTDRERHENSSNSFRLEGANATYDLLMPLLEEYRKALEKTCCCQDADDCDVYPPHKCFGCKILASVRNKLEKLGGEDA